MRRNNCNIVASSLVLSLNLGVKVMELKAKGLGCLWIHTSGRLHPKFSGSSGHKSVWYEVRVRLTWARSLSTALCLSLPHPAGTVSIWPQGQGAPSSPPAHIPLLARNQHHEHSVFMTCTQTEYYSGHIWLHIVEFWGPTLTKEDLVYHNQDLGMWQIERNWRGTLNQWEYST